MKKKKILFVSVQKKSKPANAERHPIIKETPEDLIIHMDRSK